MDFCSKPLHHKHEAEFIKHRWLLTSSLAGGFLAFGFSLSSFGLSLPTIANNLQISIDKVTPLIIARGCGLLFGSLLSGILAKFFRAYMLLVSAKVCMAIGLLFTPITLSLAGLVVFSILTGVGMAAYETIGNVAVLQMWGDKSEPVIQFLHFWFYFGAAVMPFITEPFLDDAQTTNLTNVKFYQNDSSNNTVFPQMSLIGNSNIPLIAIPYFFMSFVLFATILFVLVSVPSSFTKKSDSQQKNTIHNEGLRFRLVMLSFLFALYFFYVGWGMSFSTFLYTFGLSNVPGLNLSKESSVYLNTVLFFAIVVGQFVAIFMSKKRLSPTCIIVIDLIGVTISSLLMAFLPFYGDSFPVLFWIGVGGIGVFCASIYGTCFVWADRYITVNASAASIFIIGGAVGEMVLPIPVGLLIKNYPLSFLYINTGYIAMMIVLFIIMWKVASSKGERLQRNSACTEERNSFEIEAK